MNAQQIKKFWVEKYPIFERWFSIKIIAAQIDLCDISTKGHPERSSVLFQFVSGLALLMIYYQKKDKLILNKVRKLVTPGWDQIIQKVNSDSYKRTLINNVISGDHTIKYEYPGGTSRIKKIREIKLTDKELLLFIKRSNIFPLTEKEIENTIIKWEADLNNRYQNNCVRGDIKNMDKAVIVYYRYHANNSKKAAVCQAFKEEGWTGSQDDVYNQMHNFIRLVHSKSNDVESHKKLNKILTEALPFLSPREAERANKEFR